MLCPFCLKCLQLNLWHVLMVRADCGFFLGGGGVVSLFMRPSNTSMGNKIFQQLVGHNESSLRLLLPCLLFAFQFYSPLLNHLLGKT